jgi:hypothetical protein
MGGTCSTHNNLKVSEHRWEDGDYKIDCTKVGSKLNWLWTGAELPSVKTAMKSLIAGSVTFVRWLRNRWLLQQTRVQWS